MEILTTLEHPFLVNLWFSFQGMNQYKHSIKSIIQNWVYTLFLTLTNELTEMFFWYIYLDITFYVGVFFFFLKLNFTAWYKS